MRCIGFSRALHVLAFLETRATFVWGISPHKGPGKNSRVQAGLSKV